MISPMLSAMLSTTDLLASSLIALASACAAVDDVASDDHEAQHGEAFRPAGGWTVRFSACGSARTYDLDVAYVTPEWWDTGVTGNLPTNVDCRLSLYLDDAPGATELVEIQCGRYSPSAGGDALWLVLSDNGTTATASVEAFRVGSCAYGGAATVVARDR